MSLTCKQCGGVVEAARRILVTAVCFKCLPPLPPQPPPHSPCAPPAHPAFDYDIYDCPCGHMYGDHEYRYVERKMVIDSCVSCSELRNG